MKGKRNGNSKSMKKAENRFFSADVKGDSIVSRRKMTQYDVDVAATASPLVYAFLASTCTSATEFTNYSAGFQEYRVRAMRAKLVPRYRDNIDIGAGSTIYPGAIVSAGYIGGGSASTVAALLAADGSKVTAEWLTAEHTVTWEVNPNAKLWTRTGATVSALNDFGLQFRSTAAAAVAINGLISHDVFIEFDVDFRGRN
jgi:hypothetical protein